MNAIENPMLTSRNDDELKRMRAGMLESCQRLKIPVDVGAHKKPLNRAALLQDCRLLLEAMDAHRRTIDPRDAGIEAKETTTQIPGGPGLRRLRENASSAAIREQVQADQKRGRLSATTRRNKAVHEETTMNDATTTAAAPTTKAKKAAKPAPKGGKGAKAPAKGAKGAAAKKPAKAAGTKSPSTGVRAAKFGNDMTITFKDPKLNPRREGTEQHNRYAAALKFHGKTVGKYLEAGNKRDALSYAAAQGHVTIK